MSRSMELVVTLPFTVSSGGIRDILFVDREHGTAGHGKSGKPLYDFVSKVNKSRGLPSKVSEVQGTSSWKRLERSSNEEFFTRLIEYLEENKLFVYILGTDREFKIGEFLGSGPNLRYTNTIEFDGLTPEILISSVSIDESFLKSKGSIESIERPKNNHNGAERDINKNFRLFPFTEENIGKVVQFYKKLQNESRAMWQVAYDAHEVEQARRLEVIREDVRKQNIRFLIISCVVVLTLGVGMYFLISSIASLPSPDQRERSTGVTPYEREQLMNEVRRELIELYDNCQIYGKSFDSRC